MHFQGWRQLPRSRWRHYIWRFRPAKVEGRWNRCMKTGTGDWLPDTTAANPSICTDTYRCLFHLRVKVCSLINPVISPKRMCALVIGCSRSRNRVRLEGGDIFPVCKLVIFIIYYKYECKTYICLYVFNLIFRNSWMLP